MVISKSRKLKDKYYTPGHTELISFLLTDTPASAEPVMLFLVILCLWEMWEDLIC
jgi:hypothetical protein